MSGHVSGWHFTNGLSWRADSMSQESEPQMQPGNVYRERSSWQALTLGILLAVIGTALISVSANIRSQDWQWLSQFLAELGSAIVISGALSALWEWYLRRAFAEEIFDAAGIASRLSQAKMVAVTTDFMHGVDWAKLLDTAKELDLFVFAGRTWRSSLDQYLLRLASRPNSKINLILPDPADVSVVAELSRKFHICAEDVIAGIDETRKYFEELFTRAANTKRSTIKISYVKQAPLFTYYRIDNAYVLTTYRHGPKGPVPTLVSYKGGALADFIDEQHLYLLNKKNCLCRPVFPFKDAVADGVIQEDTANLNAGKSEVLKTVGTAVAHETSRFEAESRVD